MKATARKRRTKGTPKKGGTLLIPEMRPTTQNAVERMKAKQQHNVTTKAATAILEDYWRVYDALESCTRELHETQRKYATLVRLIESKNDLETRIQDLLINIDEE